MFEKVNKIISPEEAKAIVPMTEELAAIKKKRDAELRAIIDGSDKRKVIIIGPCSADNEDAVVDYVTRLAGLAEEVKDKFLLMPRIYTENRARKARAIKGCSIVPTPTPEIPTYKTAYAISVTCTSARYARAGSPPPTKCSIRITSTTSAISSRISR